MPGGQKASGVILRQDLTDLFDEGSFLISQNLHAESILPTIQVAKNSAHYPVLKKENRLRIPDTRRAGDGTFPRDQWEFSDDSYTTQIYGMEEPVDLVEAAENEDFIDSEETAAQMAVEKLLLAREARVAAAINNTTTFTGATGTKVITEEWDDATNAVLAADIEVGCAAIRGKCGIGRNNYTLIVTDDTLNAMLKITAVVNSITYTEAIPNMSMDRKKQFIADYLNIKNVITVSSMYDVTKYGNATPTLGKLWSNEYAMLCVLCAPSNSWKTPGLGRQPAWSRITSNFATESYPEPRTKSMIYRSYEYRGTKIFSDYGFLYSNVMTGVSTTTGV